MRMPIIRRPLQPIQWRSLSTRTLLAGSLAISACFFIAGVFVLLDARSDARRLADDTASTIVSAVAQDIARNIEIYELSLQGVISGLQLPGVGDLSPTLRNRLLFDRAATAHGLAFMDVLNENGDVTDSLETTQHAGNWASRDYFLAHRKDPSLGLYIGRPFARLADSAGITISLGRFRPDGAFAGVVVGSVQLAYFRKLFDGLKLGPHGSIALLRDDGVVLMRLPFDVNDIDRTLGAGSLLHDAMQADTPRVEADDPIDHVARRFTFRQIGRLPLFLSVGLADQDIYAGFWSKAAIVGFMGLIVTLANCSLVLRLHRELRQREVAERGSSEKSRFLVTMSHDMRTPLHAVLGYADQLRQPGNLDQHQSKQLEGIVSAGEVLRDEINRALDYTWIEARGPDLSMTRVDIQRLLMDCLALIEPGATARGLHTHFTALPKAPRWFVTDGVQLRHVVMNLLSNAVKFTPQGSVELRLGTMGELVQIEVADTGIGVPEDRRHKLFHEFERLGAERTSIKGAGLGLAIVARLISTMGGDRGYRANPGGGSVFWLTLPAGIVPDVPDEAHVAIARDPPRSLRIVVVDDMAVNRDVATGFLRAAGHHVVEARSGKEAVRLVQTDDFDVVLMDVRMPGMDGLETTRRIRAIVGPRGQVPVIAVTANAADQQVAECRSAGMAMHLSKPFRREELLAAVATSAVRQPRAALPECPPLLDLEIQQQLADCMRPQAIEEHLQGLRSQIEALLRRLVEPGPRTDPDRIADMSHNLAGSAGTLGYARLSAEARRFQIDLEADAGTSADEIIRVARDTSAELRHPAIDQA